jgi:putative transposase
MPSDRIVNPLKNDWCYHVYNRGVDRRNIFFNSSNYEQFTNLCKVHLEPSYDIIAYCLIPNHFHLLIKVKSVRDVPSFLKSAAHKNNSEGLRRFFIAYAKAVNKEQGRIGPLLCRPFRRVPIRTYEQMRYTIQYIHTNPIKHKLCNRMSDYKYSSYRDYLELDNTFVAIDEGMLYYNQELTTFIDEHEAYRRTLIDNNSDNPI